jgi:hypothetical protein
MLATAYVVVPGGLAFSIWRAYRRRRGAPRRFQPVGKIRWDEPDGP